MSLMLSWLLAVVVAVLLAVFVIHREMKIQRDFEERTAKEWNSMTEEEQKASGRENMYC